MKTNAHRLMMVGVIFSSFSATVYVPLWIPPPLTGLVFNLSPGPIGHFGSLLIRVYFNGFQTVNVAGSLLFAAPDRLNHYACPTSV
jgi:hypothetical protein